MMEADSESAANGRAIVSPDDATSSSNAGTSAGRNDEERQRSTKRRRLTLDGRSCAVPAPPAPPTTTQPPSSLKKTIVEDLRSDDEGTLVKALEDLWSVHLDAHRDDLQEMQDEFIYCGGHLAVSWIMEKHPDRKEIQMHGMDVFIEAAYLGSTNVAEHDSSTVAKQLGNTRALHVVYAAIQRFPEDATILRKGFWALMNLTCECESNCKILVEELDALPFLLERMESPLASNANVAQTCCGMLHTISKFPQMRRRMIKAKALSALGHAVENHEENVKIQKWGNEALLALLSSHETTDDQNDQSQSSPRPGS
jgi:hypothetical protein